MNPESAALKTSDNDKKMGGNKKNTNKGSNKKLQQEEQEGGSSLALTVNNQIKQTSESAKPIKRKIPKYHSYFKGKGTTEDSGILYETKMIALILLRALYDDMIQKFTMASNFAGKTGFDDIVFKTIGKEKSNILFLQAKHKEDGNITIEDFTNVNKDYYIPKYLESYLNLRRTFMTTKNKRMFEGSFQNISCAFIIFTSAREYFTIKAQKAHDFYLEEIPLEKYPADHYVIKTSQEGKVFQLSIKSEKFINNMVSSMGSSRIRDLAESISQYMLPSKKKLWPLRQMFKQFHMFLAQNVIDIELGSENPYKCKFKLSFINSDDETLKLLRRELCKIINQKDYRQDNEKDTLQSSFFKLPLSLGKELVRDSKPRKSIDTKAYIQEVCDVLLKLFGNNKPDKKFLVINIDDDTVGPAEHIQKEDLSILEKLVGTLFMHDGETHMMKLNFDGDTLSEDNVDVLLQLKEMYDETTLRAFRFNIQYYEFPKLTLNSDKCVEYDRKLVNDFLSKLYIYTNQAKQDEVESIIKTNIDNTLIGQKLHDLQYIEKRNIIYRSFHGIVHEWWKEMGEVECLTESCDFYKEAMRNVLHNRLMNMHFDYLSKITNSLPISFTQDVITDLGLLLNDTKINIIITGSPYFTSVKIYQYFKEIVNYSNYLFFEVEVLKKPFEVIITELESMSIRTMVLICCECTVTEPFKEKIKILINAFKDEKVIIIAHNGLKKFFESIYPNIVAQKDHRNNFKSLSEKQRSIILKNRSIKFQGAVIPVESILDETSLDLLSSSLLYKIIENTEVVQIRKIILNEEYDEIAANKIYQSRTLSRKILLDTNYLQNNNFSTIKSDIDQELLSINNNNMVLISESPSIFENVCVQFPQANVHWFLKNTKEQVIWQKSQGDLHTILKYVNKDTSSGITDIKNFDDLRERVVIVSADPGMGKSTLLAYLAKNNSTRFWVEKINLFDNYTELKRWMANENTITLTDTLKFLFNAIFKNNKTIGDSEYFNVINGNEILLKDNETNSCNTDISDMKLFVHFYNNNKVALLIDGFEEVCGKCANVVVQLLSVLKTSKVAYLWITSRPYNVLEQLECKLGTFTFNLTPLSLPQQRLYLVQKWSKYWPVSHKTKSKPVSYTFTELEGKLEKNFISAKEWRATLRWIRNLKIEKLAHLFISIINSVIGDNEKIFTSNPQNLCMIAEIYELPIKVYYRSYEQGGNNFIEHLERNANLTTLFKRFMENRFFHIIYGKKIPKSIREQFINFLDKDDDLTDKYDEFLQCHRIAAAHVLMDQSLLTLSERDILERFNKTVESGIKNRGVINSLIEGKPRFVHHTYAEYFAVEYIFDRMLTGSTQAWFYFICHLLTSNENEGMRRFINSKLRKDQNNIVDTLISKNEAHIRETFKNMLAETDTLKTPAIFYAIVEDFDYIALFLLECYRIVVDRENIADFIQYISKTYGRCCIFCAAISKVKQSIVIMLIDIVVQIDRDKLRYLFYCQDIDKFTPLLLAMSTREMASIILDSLTHNLDLIVELFTLNHDHGFVPTVAHLIGEHSFVFNYCRNFLLKLNKQQLIKIFMLTKDRNGRIPAHYAALDKNKKFLTEMKLLISKRKYKAICATRDNDGNTPRSLLFSAINDCHKYNNDNNFDANTRHIWNLLPASISQFHHNILNVVSMGSGDETYSSGTELLKLLLGAQR